MNNKKTSPAPFLLTLDPARRDRILAIAATVKAARGLGIDPTTANIADCCAIADRLAQREGVKAAKVTIDPRKVEALLAGALARTLGE